MYTQKLNSEVQTIDELIHSLMYYFTHAHIHTYIHLHMPFTNLYFINCIP